MWSLLVGAALAGPIFTSVSEEVALSSDGNWPRLFPADNGHWHFLHANAGDYYYVLLDERFNRVEGTDRALTGATNLRDHGVSRCPDGTYVDAATGEVDSPNDSLYVYRFDANFGLLDHGVVFERADSSVVLADVPSVCGDTYTGVAWLMPWDTVSTRYAALAPDLSVLGAYGLYDAPQAMGSSLMDEEGELRVIGFPTTDQEPNLTFASYDASYQQVAHWEADVVPDGWTPYWAQASTRVGDVYIVAHMAQDDRYDWDTQGGDLWVEAMDADWNLIDQVQVSTNEAPIGGMQPGLARVGADLVLTYSKNLHNYVYVVGLDLVACGEEPATPPDTGVTDTGVTDTGDTAPDDTAPDDTAADGDTTPPTDSTGGDDVDTGKPSSGCGCATLPGAGPPLAAPVLAGLALLRRRRG